MARMDKYHQKKSSKAWIPVLIVLLVICAGAWFGWSSYAKSLEPINPSDKGKLSITIEEGSTTGDIAEQLRTAGLIRNENFFKLHSKLQKNDSKYKAGVYEFSKSMSTDQLMEAIMKGGAPIDAGSTRKFTIPEGYNITQTVNRLVKEGLVTKEDFMDEVANGTFDYEFLADAPKDETRLEGFLYPNTYEVYADATAHEIIDKMLAEFDKLFKPEYYTKAEEMDYSVRDIVIMGSIIERESKAAAERPVMAGVFYNRLKENMKLQSCATIQYILGEPKEHLTNADTQRESPYNTYLHEGLPPGPICSPRIESIEAALYPDDNAYIYFVLSPKLDGTHNFSESYSKFEKDKSDYYKAVENKS